LSVRRKAALRLGALKDPQAVPALIELLDDNETVWDAAHDAAYALGEIGDTRAVKPLIDRIEEPFVGGGAIEALEKIGDPRMIEPLIRLFIKRPESSIATVLGNIGDKRAVEPLIDALKSDQPSIRYYVARALGKIGDKRALEALKWSFENDTEPILDRKCIRGKSVSYAAGKAIAKIKRSQKK
jgi:HEAT repeat protein